MWPLKVSYWAVTYCTLQCSPFFFFFQKFCKMKFLIVFCFWPFLCSLFYLFSKYLSNFWFSPAFEFPYPTKAWKVQGCNASSFHSRSWPGTDTHLYPPHPAAYRHLLYRHNFSTLGFQDSINSLSQCVPGTFWVSYLYVVFNMKEWFSITCCKNWNQSNRSG